MSDAHIAHTSFSLTSIPNDISSSPDRLTTALHSQNRSCLLHTPIQVVLDEMGQWCYLHHSRDYLHLLQRAKDIKYQQEINKINWNNLQFLTIWSQNKISLGKCTGCKEIWMIYIMWNVIYIIRIYAVTRLKPHILRLNKSGWHQSEKYWAHWYCNLIKLFL